MYIKQSLSVKHRTKEQISMLYRISSSNYTSSKQKRSYTRFTEKKHFKCYI